jgi:hypothetical protein
LSFGRRLPGLRPIAFSFSLDKRPPDIRRRHHESVTLDNSRRCCFFDFFLLSHRLDGCNLSAGPGHCFHSDPGISPWNVLQKRVTAGHAGETINSTMINVKIFNVSSISLLASFLGIRLQHGDQGLWKVSFGFQASKKS